MKAKQITYSRLISKGNYENEKIEICLEVEEGEKASDVYNAAKKFVERRVEVAKLSDYTINRAKQILEDKRNHTLAQIEEAEEIIAKSKVSDDDLPF
jgi:molecular chaperone DnaK (HSP70)